MKNEITYIGKGKYKICFEGKEYEMDEADIYKAGIAFFGLLFFAFIIGVAMGSSRN